MHHAIIGNGVAGVHAALEIRRRDADAEITLISAESDYHYSRTALMWGYTGQLTLRDMEPYERWFWKENRFQLVRDLVERLDETAQSLHMKSGKELKYDRLLLAVGAQANLFNWPGQELDGVSTFTTLQDLERMIAMRDRIKSAVVVGGGLIGIELVEIMLHFGVKTTYLVREPWYWKIVLSEAEAKHVHRLIGEHGGRIKCEDEIGEIKGNGRVGSVVTRAGEEIACDFVGIAVGVHPNLELCAGLETGRGIMVDPSMRTSAPNVWSAGDCAEIRYPDRTVIEQLWYTGIHQGRAAGRSMLGDDVRYERGIWYNAAQFLCDDYLNVGQMKSFRPTAEESMVSGKFNNDRDWMARIAHENDEVVGFSMLGPRWDAKVLMQWIEERRPPKWCFARLSDAEFNEEFLNASFREVGHV
jgi:NAD(P)H-nitrite reductase large subunit